MGVKFVGKQEFLTRFSMCVRSKTTSAQYLATRFRDPTFEKLMDNYKNLVKVIAIQDLILANPKNRSVSIDFLRKFPHIFHIYYDPSKLKPFCSAINASLPVVADGLVRILSMSSSRIVPLRAVFKVWKELGLPHDFEDSVISANSGVFQLCDAQEPNTHLLKLVDGACNNGFRAAVEDWRVVECCKEDCSVDRMKMWFSFKHGYPPGMRLTKNFKAKVKDWQRLPYVGPYEVVGEKKKSKAGMMASEKRAVSIVH
ncbi:Protein ROOT PRIMORDIUM DEFECTIVE 1 [Glycine max]|nr:Protein ROOT PRIMORDIUM DEFECTIVE 1 [Glycine max]